MKGMESVSKSRVYRQEQMETLLSRPLIPILFAVMILMKILTSTQETTYSGIAFF